MKTSNDEISLHVDDEGIFVERSILTLDGASNSFLNFLSSAGPAYCRGKFAGKQALVSEESFRILASRFPKASFLACQYFRPIMLGNLSVELLPSGESPGSSFLHIQKQEDSVFYASHWSKKASSALRKAVFKKAHTLLLRLETDPHDIHSVQSRRETERFLEFAQKITRAGEHLVAVVETFGEAQTLAGRLFAANLNIAYDERLFKLTKIIHDSIPPALVPPWLRVLKKYAPELPEPSVILVSKQHLLQARPRVLPSGIWVWTGLDVELQKSSPWLAHILISDVFALQSGPDLAEVQELVAEVQPSHVLAVGEGAGATVQHLARQGISAEVFSPPRLETLF